MTGLLHEYVAHQAQHSSEATALVMGDERLTYGELELASNRLARMLAQAGSGRTDRICVFAAKSPGAIVGMLATLKIGAAYVPIDIAGPASRTARILRSAEPSAVLATHSAAGLLEELRRGGVLSPEVPIGALDAAPTGGSPLELAFGPDEADTQDSAPLPVVGTAEQAAHILFTSGSTGDPKGVVITHANVTAFVEWATSYFGTRASDRISGHPPLHFDLSTFDIYATFRSGAELHLVPPATLLPRQLAAFISDAQLTQWFSVPSTFTYMAKFNAVPEEGFPSLERVVWCGEVLPTPVLVHWMRRVGQASFTNLYGPTEATIASSYFTVRELPHDETEPIPIGTACAGEELLVLDEELAPAPEGETGQLYIGGAGLSPGYWRDEQRTREVFISDPRRGADGRRIYRTGDLARVDEDGLLRFLGRADSQIKSRGYRIELGEVEAALNALPAVLECAVVGIDSGGFEGTLICCAFATVDGALIDPPALRAELSDLLPSYMLPSRWKAMDKLPKNVNGKIDRRMLQELFRAPQPSLGPAPGG